MSLTGKVPDHPARWSRPILDALRPILAVLALPVHDPYAGTGERLGALCDELGLTFTGTDLEEWAGADARVAQGDSRYPLTYPGGEYAVVTSPVYFGNRISSDYVNGPTAKTKTAGRHAYGISLGRALAPSNLARLCRPGSETAYAVAHGDCVKHWGPVALVNVDAPLADMWGAILETAGYEIVDVVDVCTPRLGGGLAGVDKRAGNEIILLAARASA